MRKLAANQFLMRSNLEELEILQLVMQMLPRQRQNWDGKQNLELTECVKIPGDGRVRIQTAIAVNNFRVKGKLSISV